MGDNKEAEYYAYFFNALSGLIDDAALSGYDREGQDLLVQARHRFAQEFKRLHPDTYKG